MPMFAVVSEIPIVMIVIFRFLFVAAGFWCPHRPELFLHLCRDHSESVDVPIGEAGSSKYLR